MPITLPIETYEVFESNFGKESAHKLVKSFEAAISISVDYKWKVTKDELLEAIRKEFVTRELFEERFNRLEIEMNERFNGVNERFNGVNGRFNGVNERFNGINERFNGVDERFKSIDERFNTLNFKLNIFIAIALIALTFANPTFVKLIERFF